jgi:hypothetical protein
MIGGLFTLATMASALRHAATEKRRGPLKIVLILAGSLILIQGQPPAPVSATVEFAPERERTPFSLALRSWREAVNEAKAAVKQAEVDALMTFYPTAYNYHGLNRSGVRQVSDHHSHWAASCLRAVGTNVLVGLDLWGRFPRDATFSTWESLDWRII